MDTGKPGLTTLTENVIDGSGHEHTKQMHYLISPKVMEAIFTEVDAMLADDVIELSNKGFLQIPLQQESRDKAAFSVPGRGLFQFKRMPLGITNLLLDHLIGPEIEPHALVYLDDVIIVTETFEGYFGWLSSAIEFLPTKNNNSQLS